MGRGQRKGTTLARTIAKAAFALSLLALALPAAPPTAAAPAPAGAPQNRAAVVIDTGEFVKTACVRFAEESISGKEALERAQVQAVFRAYSGQGTAVCALCGKGCPADESCLTCGGNNYWAYHRARAGAATYTPSQAGVSSTRVRDGDTEGWKWGPGTPPPYFSFEQICPLEEQQPSDGGGSSSPPPPPPPEASDPAPGAGPAAADPRPSARLAPTPLAPADVPPAAPSDTTTTAVPPPTTAGPTTAGPTDNEVAGASTAPSRAVEDEGGPGVSLIAFVALMAALTAWAVWARHRRRDALQG